MFAVIGLDRVEPFADEALDPIVVTQQSGVGQRRDAACFVNPGNDIRRRRPLA